MTTRLVPYQKKHLASFEVQDAQQVEAQALFHVEPDGNTIAIVKDNKTLLIGGVQPIWPGRALAWSYISKDAGADMFHVTRLAKQHIIDQGHARTEMLVRDWFTEAHRWAGMLGFHHEAKMHKFYANGDAGNMYVRFAQ